MGTYYTLYVEAKVKGQWRGINFFNEDERSKKIIPVVCGKSYVGSALDRLESRSDGYIHHRLSKDELSDEVKAAESWLFKEEDATPFDDWADNCVSYFPATMLSELTTNKKQYAGFVDMNDILAFERGDLEYIEDFLSGKQYAKLPKDARMAYRYYEWNSEDESDDTLNVIRQRVLDRIEAFNDLFIKDEDQTWIELSPSDCRVVVIIS